MSRQLIASVYKVELEYGGLCNEELRAEAGMTRERMITALDVMISKSDQDDSLVHIFCN